MATRTQADVHQLKVTLDGVSPPVWRRLPVPGGMTLGRLHDALQAAMAWTNSHLHCFELADRGLGMVCVEEDAEDLADSVKRATKELGSRLRAARLSGGLSQEALPHKPGIP